MHLLGCWGLNAIQVFQEPRIYKDSFLTLELEESEESQQKGLSVKIIPKSFVGNNLKKSRRTPPNMRDVLNGKLLEN